MIEAPQSMLQLQYSTPLLHVFMISSFASHLLTHPFRTISVYLKVHIFIFTTFGPLRLLWAALCYSPFTQERSFLSFTFLYTGGGGGTHYAALPVSRCWQGTLMEHRCTSQGLKRQKQVREKNCNSSADAAATYQVHKYQACFLRHIYYCNYTASIFRF